jgi:hypothetical protein
MPLDQSLDAIRANMAWLEVGSFRMGLVQILKVFTEEQ